MHDLPSPNKTTRTGRNYPLHILLFILTLFCTTWAGTIWIGRPPRFESILAFLGSLKDGIPYSFSLIAFLTVHEFGHFFAALRHRIRATLPYYIPLPPLPFLMSIGTMGAVINIKEPITSRKALFDTGASGPLAGFAVAFGLLLYGFLNLPPAGYIFSIHPEYLAEGVVPAAQPGTLYLGKNLIYMLFETVIAPKELPPMTEMYHYPFLFTGWLACFVTALNLLPVGQLDGGHVIYAMFGRQKHKKIAGLFLLFITVLGSPSFIEGLLPLIMPGSNLHVPELLLRWSWSGWLLWAFILSRLIGSRHPQAGNDLPLSARRMITGWLCIAIFILTFTPVPFGTK
ncbi:MAG: site-2 protease family protein [Chlorobiaceae bacterium]|nr:site-2 protease family protein [Chlorobiaceae bacterium]